MKRHSKYMYKLKEYQDSAMNITSNAGKPYYSLAILKRRLELASL